MKTLTQKQLQAAINELSSLHYTSYEIADLSKNAIVYYFIQAILDSDYADYFDSSFDVDNYIESTVDSMSKKAQKRIKDIAYSYSEYILQQVKAGLLNNRLTNLWRY